MNICVELWNINNSHLYPERMKLLGPWDLMLGCGNNPTLVVSHWRGPQPGFCSDKEAGTSAIPIWHQKPVEFPELYHSEVHRKAWKCCFCCQQRKQWGDQLTQWQAGWPNEQKMNNQSYSCHLLMFWIWTATRRFNPHLGCVLQHPLRRPGQFSRSNSLLMWFSFAASWL